jgi:hypothetical protein
MGKLGAELSNSEVAARYKSGLCSWTVSGQAKPTAAPSE